MRIFGIYLNNVVRNLYSIPKGVNSIHDETLISVFLCNTRLKLLSKRTSTLTSRLLPKITDSLSLNWFNVFFFNFDVLIWLVYQNTPHWLICVFTNVNIIKMHQI